MRLTKPLKNGRSKLGSGGQPAYQDAETSIPKDTPLNPLREPISSDFDCVGTFVPTSLLQVMPPSPEWQLTEQIDSNLLFRRLVDG
jgi:hypothetical protein